MFGHDPLDGVQTTNMFIRNFILIEVDNTYSNIYRRSYAINNLTHQTVGRFEETIYRETKGHKKITSNAIARDLGEFVGLSNRPGELVTMVNHGERRLRFLLEIEVSSSPAYCNRYLIQGYTNYLGADRSINNVGGITLDPNMVLIVNSITEFFIKNSFNPNIPRTVTKSNTYNSITELVNEGRDMFNNLILGRCIDLHQLSSFRCQEDGVGTFGRDVDISGLGEIKDREGLTSCRDNQDTNLFFAKLLGSYQDGRTLSSISYSSDAFDNGVAIFDQACTEVAEPIIYRNYFMNMIKEVSGMNGVCNQFTISSLDLALGTNSISQAKVFLSSSEIVNERIKNDTELFKTDVVHPADTLQADVLTSRILELNNSITAHVTNHGLTTATVFIAKLYNQPDVICTVLRANSLMGDEYVEPGVNKLETTIRALILPKFFSALPTESFEIQIQVDVLRDTVINIDYRDLDYKEFFRFPTFCDSLYLPVIMTKNDRNVLNNDLRTVYDMIQSV